MVELATVSRREWPQRKLNESIPFTEQPGLTCVDNVR